jgi:DUF2934 family protein
MAKSLEKKILPVEEDSSKASVKLHEIEIHINESEAINKKISELAYELFLKRGSSHGNDLGDWLEAERIVNAESKS